MSRCGSGTRPGCGKEIRWGRLDGKNIPLDMSAPVYRIVAYDAESGLYALERAPTGHHVTHFATCAKANEFSSSKRRT